MFIGVSCKKNNNNVQFDVYEEKPSLIDFYYEGHETEKRFDGEELKIYKNYSEMVDDLNSKGLTIRDNTFSEKYCDEFFENKSLVLYYSIDARDGFKYTFQSMNITDEGVVLNIEINREGFLDVITPRLFIIEMNRNDIDGFNKLKCKIKVKE